MRLKRLIDTTWNVTYTRGSSLSSSSLVHFGADWVSQSQTQWKWNLSFSKIEFIKILRHLFSYNFQYCLCNIYFQTDSHLRQMPDCLFPVIASKLGLTIYHFPKTRMKTKWLWDTTRWSFTLRILPRGLRLECLVQILCAEHLKSADWQRLPRTSQ